MSNILTKSGINAGTLDQESNSSKFTLDKQHTAVLSPFVGRVISEHKLLWFTFNPKALWNSGKELFTVSSNII